MNLQNVQRHWLRRYGLAHALLQNLSSTAAAKYGFKCPVVAGICEHWPESIKSRAERLRSAKIRYSDNALSFRPKNQQMARYVYLLHKARLMGEDTVMLSRLYS